MKRIDSHQHFWALDRGDYGWLTPELAAIYRDFGPDDLEPLIKAAGVDGTVLVQAAPSSAETDFMLDIAALTDFVRGVVGWVDLYADNAVEQIADLARRDKLVGLRPEILDFAEPGWELNPTLTPAFEEMIAQNLTFDGLMMPPHLKNLPTLLRHFPDLRSVIDHASKPQIRDTAYDDWASDITTAARETDAYCKFSGIITEAMPDWSVDTLRPYVAHLFDTFGPARIIWGSDWPVCTLAGSYQKWHDAAGELTRDLNNAERDAVFGGNAIAAYRL